MIITVTPNAAVDKTLTVPNFQTGFRHRASESLTLPGGKGVNIARALKTLGEPVVVTGLVGGRAGQQIVEGLTRENILNDFVHIAGESRTSTAVVDPTTMTQTEVVEYGPVVTEAETAGLLDKIEYLAKGARFVVLAGSLPRKVSEDFYATVLQRIRKHRCFVVLDSAGEPLRRGVRGRPNLVLPNLREAEDLVGHEFHDDQDLIDATGIVCEMGARNVIIKTQHGCVARFQVGRKQRVFRASIVLSRPWSAPSAPATRSSPGFISARFRKLDLPECLRHALAAGAASTQRYGAGVLDAARRRLAPRDHRGQGALPPPLTLGTVPARLARRVDAPRFARLENGQARGMSEVQIGESFIGDGVDAAHVNTVLGERGGPVGTAWATALATPRAGHVPFVAVVQPGLAVQPMTLFVNKAPIEPGRHADLTWGAAQAGVAAGRGGGRRRRDRRSRPRRRARGDRRRVGEPRGRGRGRGVRQQPRGHAHGAAQRAGRRAARRGRAGGAVRSLEPLLPRALTPRTRDERHG